MFKLLSRATILLLLAALLPVASARAEIPQPSLLNTILSSSPTWMTDGTFNGAEYGHSVASAGDINHDGFGDVVVGSPVYQVGGNPCGAAFVFLGGPSGLSSAPYAELTTSDKGSLFAYSVAGAGDVDNNGYDDIIVGAPSHHEAYQGAGENGAAYLFLGSATGLSLSPDWAFIGASDTQFGAAVTGAGDVNGDGFDDVLIGAIQYSQPEINEGAAYLFLGSESGLNSTPTWIMQSNQPSAQFGFDVAGIGDLNHDGYADIAISAPTADLPPFTPADPMRTDAGLVWVFLGSATGPNPTTPNWTAEGPQPNTLFGSSLDGAGDVDGNGYADLIVGARGYDGAQADIGAAYLFYNIAGVLSPTAGWFITSDQSTSGFGSAVAGLGDVNGDGFADVAVGAPNYDGDQSHEGMAFVYNGTSFGTMGFLIWKAGGNKAGAKFGASLASAGDVNGDNLKDIVVGAPDYKRDEKTKMGAAFLYHGIDTGGVPFFSVFLPIIIR